MNVNEVVAQCLAYEGADSAFVLLGDANLSLVAAAAANSTVQLYHGRHEAAVVAMAEGFAHATGNVGYCFVTAGPGLANAVVSITSAVRSHAPVVILTGPHGLTDKTNPQSFDHEGLARLTGAGYELLVNPGSAVEVMRSAVYRARVERRPVIVDIPIDVQGTSYPWPFEYTPTEEDLVPLQRLGPDPIALDRAVAALAASERPVILAGRGADESGAARAIAELAEHLGALVSTTLPSRGMFSEDPFSIGVAGLFSSPLAAELFAVSDCVLACGASLNHFTTEGGYLFPNATIVQIDHQAQHPTGSGRKADHYVRGDVRSTVELMSASFGTEGATVRNGTTGRRFRNGDTADRIRNTPIDTYEFEIEPGTLDPRSTCEQLDGQLPHDYGLVVGCGHFFAFPIMHMLRARKPLIDTYHFGAIGQGLSVALGAAIGAGARPTVLIEGDASLMMSLSEVETVARYQPRLLVVVLNDAALGAEFHKLRAAGLDETLAVAPETDLAEVARALGCAALTVTSEPELCAAIETFVTADGPLVLDCRISREVVSRTYRRLHLGIDA